ncbi:carboxypeptidase-like regulatory domain-containing protein [Anaeromyxobacter oryzisoli]|uniref:carboxypeptidase-like regulatory domain-containing protein n=1 Tax=Anaeromyxobacter oryzisoli TaxID=2925408 RepID=UPI001F57AEC2|nr:carboxypeptidase-like regulatory domain-containing protein [Anaeromyxobacter sp. SG63]
MMKGFKRLALALCAASPAAAIAAGGTTYGYITGTVKDIKLGGAMSGVTITDGRQSVTTSGNGSYTLKEAAGSTYTLKASTPGYQTTWQISSVTANVSTIVDWALTPAYGTQPIPAANMRYAVFSWNDLGMHCDQDDYSYFMVLPPYNTLHVQVMDRSADALVTSGITVSYSFPKKTNSTLHTNFWSYASQYGFNVAPNVGITGSPLAGTMHLDANGLGFVAEGIPITPYDDDGTWDPYGTAVITVKDAAGNVLQTTNVVAPVSTEMMCVNCHAASNPQLDILQRHDQHQGTTLAADQSKGIVHACSECHPDNALGRAGKPGVENLSLAMHNFHKDKMAATSTAVSTTPDCYNCHPGPKTQCMRGIMFRAGKSCHDCHGDMSWMASSLQNGRRDWLDEPKCGGCHDAKHAENSGTLYRNSILSNAPNSLMNGKLYCEACHNSTHGELTTANAADPTIPQQLQGDSYWIWNCTVCHANKTIQQMHR